MSTNVWVLIAAVAAVTFAIKAAGPLALGGRTLPARLTGVIALLAPALLAALVVAGVAGQDAKLGIGVEVVGVAVGGVLALRGGSVLTCVVVAAAITAALRLVT